MDELGLKLAQLLFLGNGVESLLVFFNTNRIIYKRMDIDVAFTQEYSKV
jgi:hypothetical protein